MNKEKLYNYLIMEENIKKKNIKKRKTVRKNIENNDVIKDNSKKKATKKKDQTVKIILIVILLVLIGVGIYVCVNLFKGQEQQQEPEEEEIVDVVVEEKDENQLLWEKNKAINEDYVGQIVFDSKLVDLGFVCPSKDYHAYTMYTYPGNVVSDYENGCEGGPCSGNDVYLRTDWETMNYHEGGSLFMDYRNITSDQNIIIYGHNYVTSLDPNREKFFTPLEFLMKEENYEKNKYLNVILDGEVRRYEVVYVYLFDPNSEDYDTLQYFRTAYDYDYYGNPDPGYYQSYIDNIEAIKLYDTGLKLTTEDITLTLQTCIENSTYKEIVVCRQIEYKPE